MAVQSFVKGDDLKKLIDDKLINAQSVKYVLRQKGILPVCTNSEALSDLIHHHFFGSATMTQMQEVMNFEQNKVDFFDDFGVYTHKEWKLTDIINVTVNKDEKSIDDENDVTTSGEIDASEPSGRLSGISSAILKGDGLRNNDFVKECMSQGFIFSSMSYKFSHKTLPITIVIDVNFKQTDLKINIVKTYQLEDDGIERLAPLPSSDQSLYIDYFQNVAYAVYSNLIEKQKDELVKQTIKPEK